MPANGMFKTLLEKIWQCFFECLDRKNSWEIPGEYEWLFELESFVNKLCFGILFLNLFCK